MGAPEHPLAPLRAAATTEDAALALLRWARSIAQPLEDEGARLARGILHVRSEQDGYRGLFLDEWLGCEGSVAASATLFGWIERGRTPIALDVGSGRGAPLHGGETIEVPAAYVAHDGAASVQQMMARHVSHVVTFPLADAGGLLVGMLSLELCWPRGLGRMPLGGAWADTLQLACTVAAERLRVLPRAERSDEPFDPLLPVVGARTAPLVDVLRVFARQDETILIGGPTGAGKTRLAAWCHARSARADGPFETANLLAVPDAMQMAELFGWRRGAFTDASRDHDGVVAEADGGTLFIDEIDKLSLKAQAGLLRFLDTRRFTPLGGERDRTANVRIIVGTNADLRELVRRGSFREDLFYRIHVLPVRLPPLVERADEIPRWASYFVARRHEESGQGGRAVVADGARERLARAEWPGNLRQLENVMRRAYALRLARLGPARDLIIEDDDARRALELEGNTASSGSAEGTESLDALARAIVEAAVQRRREGSTLPLASLQGLQGAVLREATARLGSAKSAYLLFGEEQLVENRNHTKAYRRELERTDALRAILEGGGAGGGEE